METQCANCEGPTPRGRRTCSPKCLSEWRSQDAKKRAAPITDRFWTKVERSNECWEWTGGRTIFGYGVFAVGGRLEGAHRFSWRLHFGDIAGDLCVLHRCDNPPCVRPDHLFLGTKADNAADCQQKGRGLLKHTHCKHGHLLDEANSYEWMMPSGKMRRFCRACGRRKTSEWEQTRRSDDLATVRAKARAKEARWRTANPEAAKERDRVHNLKARSTRHRNILST